MKNGNLLHKWGLVETQLLRTVLLLYALYQFIIFQASVDKLQERIRDLLKEAEKLRLENDKLKTKNDSLTLVNNELGPLKKQVTSLRAENIQLQKSSTTNLQQLSQVEKTKDFYEKAFKEADDLGKSNLFIF